MILEGTEPMGARQEAGGWLWGSLLSERTWADGKRNCDSAQPSELQVASQAGELRVATAGAEGPKGPRSPGHTFTT